MAQQQISLDDQLAQLNTARALVLQDTTFYPQIFNGILPIVTAPNSVVELRRWGADFLAETFSSPVLATNTKQELALTCLDSLLSLVNETQTGLLKSVIQCCASIYPLVFRFICTNRDEKAIWDKMASIKSRVLGLWDNESEGIRLACIKFVQRVILVQTPGASDPRRIEKSEVSLTLVPINHPLLAHPALEAEAQGLLDRLLSVLISDKMDAPVISATLNCLPTLIKTRATISNKILNILLAYNPIAIAARSRTFSDKFIARSVEKTVRQTLIHLIRASPQGPNAQRLSQHIQRLLQAKADLAEDKARDLKRGAPSNDDLESTKRQRNSEISQPISNEPLNGTTYATLYTLTGDQALSTFDVQQLPLDIVLQITLATIFSLNQQTLDTSLHTIRSRYQALVQAASFLTPTLPPLAPTIAAPTENTVARPYDPEGGADSQLPQLTSPLEDGYSSLGDDDDYVIREPDEVSPAVVRPDDQVQTTITTESPGLQKLNIAELKDATEGTLDRMFGVVDDFEKTVSKKEKVGLNRLAASNWDRDGWIIVLSRLGTRALSGINDVDVDELQEENIHVSKLSTSMREKIYAYIMADFRGRMDTAVGWLNEEWYNDKVMGKAFEGNGIPYEAQYVKWMTKVMDGIVPYLEATDRIFLRFLSDLPEIPTQLLQNLRMLCLDPERSSLGFLALQYLTMLKPPVREVCLDIVEDLWRNHKDVQTASKKILQRFRPDVLKVIAPDV